MLSQLKKQLPSSFVMVLILCLGSVYLFNGTMDKYPVYVHAWTQSDRVAIAQNFQENGFNFFQPATYNLLTKDGITQVDFPIHDYIVAIIGKVSNIPVVQIFHWYNLLYSLIGLFFLFQLLLLLSKSPLRSIIGTTFIFTLPFFVYYQNGFIPSTASFANLFIGLYFIVHSLSSKKGYTLGILFVTVAALARAPFFVFLFALFLVEALQGAIAKKINTSKLWQLTLAIAIFIGYYIYNQYLGTKYGSMFLSETLHFKSFSNFLEVILSGIDRWSDQLLSPYHAILLLLLIVTSFSQYNILSQASNRSKFLLSFLLISGIGVLLFFIAFGRQFVDHDYYYIDSFLPLFTLWFIYMLSSIKIPAKWYTFIGTGSLLFFFYFFGYAKDIQTLRYTPPFDDRVEYAYHVYQDATEDIEKWGVQKNDTLFVVGANSTNIPFTIWGNKGFTNLKTRASVLEPELDSNFTYAIMVDSFYYSYIYKDYPQIINRLERINGNGQLSLYKKSLTGKPSSFFKLLHYEVHSNFDNQHELPTSSIQGFKVIENDSIFGKSLNIQKNNLYALTVKDTIRKKEANIPLRVQMVGDFFQSDTSRIQAVLRVGNYYGAHYTVNELKVYGAWQRHQFSFVVDPSKFEVGDQWEFYFWNPEKTELVVDNMNLIIYQ